MSVKPNKQTVYLPYLDGLRAIAATYVVLYHIVLQFHFNYDTLPKLEKYSIIIFFFGHFAVNFFIVLSGFCLTIPLIKQNDFRLKGGILLFYKKRIRRIVLPYYIVLAISFILITFFIGKKTGTHWDLSIPVTFKDITMHLLLVHDVFTDTMYKINHALWTISVEFRIYLFFPLLLWLWRRSGPFISFLSTIVISVTAFAIATFLNNNYHPGIDQQLDGLDPYIILFGLGMLAAYISLSTDDVANKLRNMPWLMISVALLVFTFSPKPFLPFVNGPYSFQFVDVSFGFWSFSFLVLISGDKVPVIKRMLSAKPLVAVGAFAYSIYLFHAPLIQLIWQYVIHPLHLSEINSYYLAIAVGLPLILLASYAFYLLFERPFMNHKKPNA